MLPDYIDLPRKGGSGLIDIEECVKKRFLAWMPEEWRRVDAAVLKEKVLLMIFFRTTRGEGKRKQ